jgi:hypothetical protein
MGPALLIAGYAFTGSVRERLNQVSLAALSPTTAAKRHLDKV